MTHSPAADWFAGIWKRVSIGGVTLAGDVGHLIVNDGGKIGTLAGSLVSAVVGATVLLSALRR